jgi:hypothetical protein
LSEEPCAEVTESNHASPAVRIFVVHGEESPGFIRGEETAGIAPAPPCASEPFYQIVWRCRAREALEGGI